MSIAYCPMCGADDLTDASAQLDGWRKDMDFGGWCNSCGWDVMYIFVGADADDCPLTFPNDRRLDPAPVRPEVDDGA